MKNRIFALSVCCSTLALTAWAVSPADVQKKLVAGEKLTLVDVRSVELFKQGHIPNAINIPASLVPLKELPPLGAVVVYDDGLGPDIAQAAAAALNKKHGITAHVLDGGFAAWQAARSPTTAARGVQKEEFPMITYDRLKQTPVEDLVLVDLRHQPTAAPAKSQMKAPPQPLTDLAAEFPNARITHSPFDSGLVSKNTLAGSSKPPLLVLIDNNDGAAQAMSRNLKANGVTRFVILAGGEEILARKGQPGLQRSAGSFTVPGISRPSVTQ